MTSSLYWVEFKAPPDSIGDNRSFRRRSSQPNNKEKHNINHKNTHINTIQIKENKQLNIQQKQNYPDSVASYDTQPGNEVGLFYNGPPLPEHHTGHRHHHDVIWSRDIISHVTIRLSIDDFLYVLNRNQTYILLSFPDIYIMTSRYHYRRHNAWINYPRGSYRHRM